jgi:RNA polymerase sigma-70 factor, ECF subfamily
LRAVSDWASDAHSAAAVTSSDANDLDRLRAGDVGSFEALFFRYHATLCEIADAYVGSQAVAEEIVQDLFHTIWRERERLVIRGSLRSYLCVAARNRALQHLRHGSVARRHAQVAAVESDVDREPRADEVLERKETLLALRVAIDALPPRARLAVVLRWRDHLTNADVAEAMGITVKGVEKLLATAMTRLRHLMRSHKRDR